MEPKWLTNSFGPTGAGESGKSTLLKQMKLIYNAGFSRTERLEWRPVVFSNIIQSFRLISSAMVELDIDFANKDNEVGQFQRGTKLFTYMYSPHGGKNFNSLTDDLTILD